MNYKPRVMLVTGGAGFIGANFINYIFKHEPDVFIINLDKLTYAANLNHINVSDDTRYRFIQGDITDGGLISRLLEQYSIDTIVNFAAESHVDRSIASPLPFVNTNVHGTFVLLEAARKHWLQNEKRNENECRFHQISTDEVYGSLTLEAPPFTEASPYQPRSPYAASKASADHLVFAYHHTYGLPITLSRCSNNYGPYQHEEKFIPTVIRHCFEQRRIPIYGSGKNIRDWLYVDDHCRGILSIIKNGFIGEDYNMGGANEWGNLSLATYICERMDAINPMPQSHKLLLSFVEDRLGHDFRYAINPQKIATMLGWQASENMVSGIDKTIHFYLEQLATTASARLNLATV